MQTDEGPVGLKLDLLVNGEPWQPVSDLRASNPEDRHYVLEQNEDGGFSIRFGDGKQGARPPGGTELIQVSFDPQRSYLRLALQQGRPPIDAGQIAPPTPPGAFYGLYRGIVTDDQDPLALQRVRLRVPEILGDTEIWALPCLPVGATSVPGVGRPVWVQFERGDPGSPVWMGELPSIGV